MTPETISRLRVRYAETDQMGIAWHGNFLAWFEVGRTDLLRHTGLTYRDLELQGLRLPVIEAHTRYLRPARYDDALEIHTALAELRGARLRFEYTVRREGEGQLLALGSTEHAAVDPQGRPRRLPEKLRGRLTGAFLTGNEPLTRQGGSGGSARAIAVARRTGPSEPPEMRLVL